MKDVDIAIIGAGVISMSIAYYLSKKGYKIAIIEKENSFGLGASNVRSNSSVIHAGIYYKKNSLKSKLCMRGKSLLKNFCKENNIEINNCGKIITAKTIQDLPKLEKCFSRAQENGLKDLKYLNKKQLEKIEPNLSCYAGLFSPSSGVLDTKSYLKKLIQIIKTKGVSIFFSFDIKIEKFTKNYWLITNIKNNFKITSKMIINSSGKNAPQISKRVLNLKDNPLSNPVLGYYLRYEKKNFLNKIVYSAIEPGVIHERVDATPMISKYLLFGPSVEKINLNKKNYFSPQKIIKRYLPIIKSYFPKIETNFIKPFSYGIRPKIKLKSKIYDDFIFKLHKKEKWLDILGIESPGLTSSLAIGEHVKKMIEKRL